MHWEGVRVLTASDVTEENVEKLNQLYVELYNGKLPTPATTLESLERAMEHSRILVSFYEEDRPDGEFLLGMVTLASSYRLRIRMGWIEDVVVARHWRRKGLAIEMMNRVHELVRKEGIGRIELLTNKDRVEAHALYLKLG